MKPSDISLRNLLVLCCCQLPPVALALDSDRSAAIHIEANRATLDEQGGVSVYEGDVYLHQGTLALRGERMTVTLKNDQIDHISMEGSPARFSQRPEGADSDQQAEADHIEYNTRNQRLLLQGEASIRQTGREEFRSDRIEFNLQDNTVNAGGTGSGNRVHITLQPATPEKTPDTTPENPEAAQQ